MRVRGTPVQAVQKRPVVFLAVVIGRCETGRLDVLRGSTGRNSDRLGVAGVASAAGARCGRIRRLAWFAGSALWLRPSRANSSAACDNLGFEIFHRSRDIEVAVSTPLRSKSSAASSSLATSLSRDFVVVVFFAMPSLPCTSAAERLDFGFSRPHYEAEYGPRVS